MPPTTGHLNLIQFAEKLADAGTVVLLNTQPDEPFWSERPSALREAVAKAFPHGWVDIVHLHRELPQDPETPGFRALWKGIMIGQGAEPGDLLVTSETYGKWLAEMTDMVWMPYDIDRSINYARASNIRRHPSAYWDSIIPEFRPHLQTRVTIFGAESTGKTRLARNLGYRRLHDQNEATNYDGYIDYDNESEWFPKCHVLPEYARPYLESTTNEITVASMTAIWKGQKALQEMPLVEHPLIIQDTDLYSTVGYWNHFSWYDEEGQHIGRTISRHKARIPEEMPHALQEDAHGLRSDLYLITPSDGIPFEPDPLRYGGDHRELDDKYWITQAKGYGLPYKVLDAAPSARVDQAVEFIKEAMAEKAKLISYDRKGL